MIMAACSCIVERKDGGLYGVITHIIHVFRLVVIGFAPSQVRLLNLQGHYSGWHGLCARRSLVIGSYVSSPTLQSKTFFCLDPKLMPITIDLEKSQ